MEDSKKIKIISWVAFSALILAVSSVALTAGSAKKSGFRGSPVSPASTPQASDGPGDFSPIGSIDESQKATGFVGLPTGDAKSGVESNLKKFELKGHWTFKEKPGFDYIGKDENTRVTVIANENTKILKLIAPSETGQETTIQEISFKDFQIESQSNPYLAIFDEPTSISFQMILAKEIRIFLEVK